MKIEVGENLTTIILWIIVAIVIICITCGVPW